MRIVLLAIAGGAACASTTPPQASVPTSVAQTMQRPDVMRVDTSPWSFRWDAQAERERLARRGDPDPDPDAGAGAGDALRAEYARLCARGGPPEVSGSPLMRYRENSYNTTSGVVIVLSPLAGPRESLLADLRCHQVGLLVAPVGADDSPFDVPGLAIDAAGDRYGITLTLTVADPGDLTELQRRVERQVEETERPRHED